MHRYHVLNLFRFPLFTCTCVCMCVLRSTEMCHLCACTLSHLSHVQLFCNPMDFSSPGSSVLGILQARMLEWVAMPSSRGFSQSRAWTQVSRIAGRFFTIWATREALYQCEPFGIGLAFILDVWVFLYLSQNLIFSWFLLSLGGPGLGEDSTGEKKRNWEN